MKIKGILLGAIALLLLTACSKDAQESRSASEETAENSSTSKIVRESEETSSVSQDQTESRTPTMDKNVHYNGSYYYVEGKYGPIVIANKHYPLAADYNPGEDPEAQAALMELIADMQAAGYPISDQYSGFRSYDTQVGLYQNYVDQDGQAAADRYSARPGYSEHQTGLAYDLIDTAGNLVQEEKASKWLLKNAGKYGFVVRYLHGKEKETGYMPEEWHLRYIGKEAEEVAKSGLSLEEYYGFTGGDYED